MNPKRAALLGLVFPVIAVVYFALTTALGGTLDFAGLTLLLALGVAVSLMAFVLVAGVAKS